MDILAAPAAFLTHADHAPPPACRQDEALSQRRQLESLFAKDTADAYRVFDTMEHFLRQPEHLRGQLQVQLGGATQVHTWQK